MSALVAPLRRLAFRLWSRLIRRSVDSPDPVTLFGLDLIIDPGVLHPRHFASSRMLARHVMTRNLAGRSVADLGTGSGLLALLAARAGAKVTALDLSPAAVSCASENARRNGLQDRVRVIRSDVFAGLEGADRFDFVITNPPFYARDATSLPDHAFAAGASNDFFARLAASLPARLTGDGVLLMILSSDIDDSPIARVLEARGLQGRVLEEKRGLFETLTIREFSVRPGHPHEQPPT
jgi:release factor glutamine methyltransferase